MGMMNKMRENTGVVLWILVISFGGLWVLQDSGVFDTIGVNPLGKIIVVDGDPITVEEYQRQLDAQIEQYRQQTNDNIPPQVLDQAHEQVYSRLVDNKLREHEMDRLGIMVSKEEVTNLVLGDDPHPIIKLYFDDGQGGVDRALLQNFIDDPEATVQLLQIEEYLRVERRREKFDNLVAATVRVSDEDVEAAYHRNTTSASAEFFLLRYSDVPDDSVTLTDGDVRRFYNEHREDFKQERRYSLQLASLSKQPSQADTLALFRELESLRPNFAAAENDSLFLLRNASERPYTSAFFAAADLDAEIAHAVFEAPEAGKIVGPVLSGNEAHLIKITDTRPAEETNVRARHILIRAAQGNEAQLAQARQEIEALRERILNGEDFAELARQHSTDPVSAARGGDLGWFGPGGMVAPFEEAAFGATVGRVTNPVETQYGVHLIEVTQRAAVDVRLADYALGMQASTTTIQHAEERLQDLVYYADDNGDFLGEAQRQQIPLQDVEVEAEQQIIPGFGNSRSLTRFLETASVGDISEVIELNDVYIVATVTAIQPEGYRPQAEVEAEIRPRALLEKKRALQRTRMEQAYRAVGFDGLANALGITARTAANISFNSQVVPGLGRDPVFAGTVLGLDEGKDSGVVEGANGVFVAKVTRRTEPQPITDAERERLRTQLLNSQKSQLQTRWIASLRDNAEIDDLRATFQQ